MQPSLGGQPWGPLRATKRPHPPPGGLCRSGHALLASPPQGQTRWARLEQKPDTGQALSLLAPTLGRAVSCRLKRKVGCARELFRQTSGSSAGEPGASLDAAGMSLARACSTPSPAASGHAKARLGRDLPAPARLLGHPLWLRKKRRWSPPGTWAAPPPSPARPGESPRLRQAGEGDGLRARHDF
jgi:hypothetical protein